MKRINYPTDPRGIKKFHKKFYTCFQRMDKRKINRRLRQAPKYRGRYLTFKTLITSSFEDLIDISILLKTYDQKNTLGRLFDYSKNQPYIASFFMDESHLGLKKCYYCDIDYINSFKDIEDYHNYLDFLNRAGLEDLQIVTGIGPETAKKIIEYRKGKKIEDVKEITKREAIIDFLEAFDFKHSHNHFTLDHVLPQKEYKFLSLCLYNLVPCCYSCNSKFKKAKSFLYDSDIAKISPTSQQYQLSNDFQFQILFAGEIQDIKETSDFSLVRKIYRNNRQLERYSSIFKIAGRYAMHKDQLLGLIENKMKYSDSNIAQMAKEMGVSQNEVRRIIYGSELFKEDSFLPLHKLKRDIAKNIGIL